VVCLRFEICSRAYHRCRKLNGHEGKSSVNLGASGSLTHILCRSTLGDGQPSQTLLATHFNGQPLTVDHGAPLRLLVP